MGKIKLLIFVAVFVILFNYSFVSASFSVEKKEKGNVIISEMDNPAIYEFNITNHAKSSENAEIYSLVGLSFLPRGQFELYPGENVIEVKAYPSDEQRTKTGLIAFDYEIKGSVSGIYKDRLLIKIVPLKDALWVGAEEIAYGDREATIIIKNRENTHINNLDIHFSSEFFEGSKTLSFKPFEEKRISATINKNVNKLGSGSYVVKAEIKLKKASVILSGVVNYVEKRSIVENRETNGLLIRTTSIEHKNEGNAIISDRIKEKRNVLTRLFTTSSIEPIKTERIGLFVYYDWQKELKPGESWKVELKTNYTLPFLLVITIAIIVWLGYIYSRTSLEIRKRVSFVRTKGGQFALKVFVNLKARKTIENVHLVDRIPSAMKLYEGYGSKPHQVDVNGRRLLWNIDKLNAGEERVFSYIIYSNVGVVGRFEAPLATATFTRNGKQEMVHSNRAFFVSDTQG
ncbi:MAG: hypothetical protein N3D20_00960 [Candidatus Pacearchaeota archaeon]|nr:hypothetical protein [Candidatus Pacearchaeota archaeon]